MNLALKVLVAALTSTTLLNLHTSTFFLHPPQNLKKPQILGSTIAIAKCPLTYLVLSNDVSYSALQSSADHQQLNKTSLCHPPNPPKAENNTDLGPPLEAGSCSRNVLEKTRQCRRHDCTGYSDRPLRHVWRPSIRLRYWVKHHLAIYLKRLRGTHD